MRHKSAPPDEAKTFLFIGQKYSPEATTANRQGNRLPQLLHLVANRSCSNKACVEASPSLSSGQYCRTTFLLHNCSRFLFILFPFLKTVRRPNKVMSSGRTRSARSGWPKRYRYQSTTWLDIDVKIQSDKLKGSRVHVQSITWYT